MKIFNNTLLENKKIPTLFGIVILVLGIIVTSYSISATKNVVTRASTSGQPKIDIKKFITNIRSNSFIVNWNTDRAVLGSISYGATPRLGLIASEKTVNTTHSITVSNGLVKSTKYFFKIISGEKTYGKDGTDQPYEITTLEQDIDENITNPLPTKKSSRFPSIDINNQIQDELPTFKGSGEPGTIMQIKVESPETFTDTVKVNADGSWSWIPPSNLTPGDHKVTLTLVDENGKIQTIVKEFQVIAGNPLLPITSGSSSATLTPSLSPVASPTSIPTIIIPSPTPIVTPQTGILDFLPLFFIAGGLLMIASFVLL